MSFENELRRTFETLTDQFQEDLRRHVQKAVETLSTEQARSIEQVQSDARAESTALAESHAQALEVERSRHADHAQALEAEVSRHADRAQALEAERSRHAEHAQALEAERSRHAEETQRLAGASERTLDGIRLLGRARSLSDTLDALVSCAARSANRVALVTVRDGCVHGWRFVGFGALDDAPPHDMQFDGAGVIATAVRSNAIASGEAPSFADLPANASCLALPIALGQEVVAVLYADAGSAATDATQPPDAIALEVLTRHATKVIEALMAFRVVQSLTGSGTAPQPSPAEIDEDEEDARRYARLLVSEIKLYHADAVAAGRRDRDLGSRLGGEIARARVLYEQRVPRQVRERAPYFDEEIVSTLADGDRSLLETAW